MIKLWDHQRKALAQMKNGCILCGGVGSGKSKTSLAYYYIRNGGDIDSEDYTRMENPKDLYVITTAKKRDDCEWEEEMIPFYIRGLYDIKVVVDSWNNVMKYSDVKNSFFIFDEQRVVGSGAWSKAFIKIAKANEWILLTATPGDTWSDYIPVFIANGFYKGRTDFYQQHVIWSPWVNFRKIDRYVNLGKLIRFRREILIKMDDTRSTVPHDENITTLYDKDLYDDICKNRWNYDEGRPIESPGEYCQLLRKVVNKDISKRVSVLEILEDNPRLIIFYNYDYELEILKQLTYFNDTIIAEWNGHKHDRVPIGRSWVYLVQYNAGAEGWNCITTNAMIFFSLNYSYKVMVQAAGRINRMNTPFSDLYYYKLVSQAGIDKAIQMTLKNKKIFNEKDFAK